jgi:hypothetical protein
MAHAAAAPEAEAATKLFNAVVDALEGANVAEAGRRERALLASMIEGYLAQTAPEDDDAASAEADESVAVAAMEEQEVEREAPTAALAARSRLHRDLTKARRELRSLVPYGSVAEQVTVPPFSTQFDPTVPHYDIDNFLFDDEDLDDLVEAGTVHRFFCTACGTSEHLKTTQFISHSFGEDQLMYLGLHVLPFIARSAVTRQAKLKPRQPPVIRVADVGSRLGVVVATAAWSLTRLCRSLNAPLLVRGLEMNSEYCGVQRRFFRKMGLGAPMVDVMEGDALAAGSPSAAFLEEADLVVLHNVFEWFMPHAEQLAVWRRVKALVRSPGQYLLVVPALEDTLAPLTRYATNEDDQQQQRQTTSSNGAEPKKKAHRTEESSAASTAPATFAERFIAGWVERVDTSRFMDKFMTDRSEADGGESEGDVEHTVQNLSNMALYRVIG